MIRYALVKLGLSIPTLFIVSVIVFALVRLAPGDPAEVMIGDVQNTAALAAERERLGLDEPLPLQYAIWVSNVVEGDLGRSISTGEPVLSAMLKRAGVTARIVLAAVFLAACIAIPAGLLAAARQNSVADVSIVSLSILCLSVPSFWVGLMLILVFGVQLDWLPPGGYFPAPGEPLSGLPYLVLPVISLVLVETATILRMTRSNAIEVLRQDYITHARAKGLGEAAIIVRHVFRNAFAPTMTVLGLILGSLLGGAAVIETVYTLPGLGRFLVDAIYARDYPVIQGVLILVSAIYVAANLLVDLFYPLLDPRVRLS